jgi:hypothetical protein
VSWAAIVASVILAAPAVRAQKTKIAAPATDVGSNSVYQAIVPCRMVDTRKTTAQGYPPPYGTPAFGTGEQRTFTVTGPIASGNPCAGAVPAGVGALAANVTVVNAAGIGDIRLGPGTATPTTSTQNFVGGETLANSTIVSVSIDQVTARMGGAGADVLIDVLGYYLVGGPIGASLNPLQIAILRWYPALGTGQTIAVGSEPNALAFDGANIWVANHIDGTVQKIPVATGVPGSPIPLALGSAPFALAFDGANIWVANNAVNSVQKIPVATGVPGSPIAVGSSPVALAFDGANIWVANQGDATVQSIPVATGVPGSPIAVGANPYGLAFDGANIWVANRSGNTVQSIPVATGVPGSPIAVGSGPWGLAFDGANMWVANSNASSVQKIPVATGVPGSPITVGFGPRSLAFDGANIWVANGGGLGNTVQKIPVATGVPGSPIAVGSFPVALAFDGANIWVANVSDGTVQKE